MNKLTMNECLKRRLDDTYIVIYAIKNEINIKKADFISKEIIYTFVGIDLKGFRQLINVYQDKTSNNHYWIDCFETLKSRGIKNILFISVDNNKNLKRGAKLSFPDVTFVDSLTDVMPKFYKYTSERNERGIGSKINSLYTQKTTTDFKNEFDKFKSKYNNSIHLKLIDKYLNNVESLYKYSYNIRKLLFKPSANMYLFGKIRLAFNHNENYIEKLEEIYDRLGDIKDYFGFTSFQKKEWTLMINDLIEMYKEIDFI